MNVLIQSIERRWFILVILSVIARCVIRLHIDWIPVCSFFLSNFFHQSLGNHIHVKRSACYIHRSPSLPRPTFWAIQYRILLSTSWFLHSSFRCRPQIFNFESGSNSKSRFQRHQSVIQSHIELTIHMISKIRHILILLSLFNPHSAPKHFISRLSFSSHQV